MKENEFTKLLAKYPGRSIIFETDRPRWVRIDIGKYKTYQISYGDDPRDVRLTSDYNQSSKDRIKWRIKDAFEVGHVKNVWIFE
jgi:hypothetical protein